MSEGIAMWPLKTRRDLRPDVANEALQLLIEVEIGQVRRETSQLCRELQAAKERWDRERADLHRRIDRLNGIHGA